MYLKVLFGDGFYIFSAKGINMTQWDDGGFPFPQGNISNNIWSAAFKYNNSIFDFQIMLILSGIILLILKCLASCLKEKDSQLFTGILFTVIVNFVISAAIMGEEGFYITSNIFLKNDEGYYTQTSLSNVILVCSFVFLTLYSILMQLFYSVDKKIVEEYEIYYEYKKEEQRGLDGGGLFV